MNWTQVHSPVLGNTLRSALLARVATNPLGEDRTIRSLVSFHNLASKEPIAVGCRNATD